MKHILLSALACGYGWVAMAQGPGSATIYGGGSFTQSIATGGTVADISETVYIGPGTYTIDGTWEIYSRYIVIDPAAIISGNGSIQLYNPSVAGGVSSRNFIDGNNGGNALNVKVVFNNASGVEITEIPFPSDLAGAGFTNSSNNTLYLGIDLQLAVDGADVWLDADAVGDLRFGQNATISDFGTSRMIITNNSIISHVVQDQGGGKGRVFTFPVGISDGDYTPASITGNGEYHVSVIDYSSTEPQITAPEEGIDRVWHIYGGTATSVTLIHNMTSNGTNYVDDQAFITRYQGSGSWTTSTDPDYTGPSGHHTNSAAIPSGIPTTTNEVARYLSKTSDQESPLPVTLVSFEAKKENGTGILTWATSSESNSSGFAIEHSTSGKNWTQVGYVKSLSGSGFSNVVLKYGFNHASLSAGKNFYRLKMEDLDGTYSFSTIRVIDSGKNAVVSIFPNPVTDLVTISGLGSNGRVQAYDPSGTEVAIPALTGMGDRRSLDLSGLPTGIYLLKVTSDTDGVSTFKVVKR